jgi:F-type H+-transporting ATPase subunit b
MEQTLNQLRDLLLGSIPTIVLFTIVYIAYRVIVHKPLVKALAERRARTEGAIEQAQRDIAAAEEKTAQYEARLRQARFEVYQQMEARRKQWVEERDALVRNARQDAEAAIQAARAQIRSEIEAAKAEIQRSSESLAQEVVRSILRTEPVGVGQ